jgi:hypothetical protein
VLVGCFVWPDRSSCNGRDAGGSARVGLTALWRRGTLGAVVGGLARLLVDALLGYVMADRRKGVSGGGGRSALFSVVAWALLFAAMVVLEGLGLTLRGWPAVSDLFRDLSRPVAGRWALFGAWLWLGWAFFLRRRARPASTSAARKGTRRRAGTRGA